MKRQSGRPRKYPGTLAQGISISLPATLVSILDIEAESKGRSRSQFVTEIIAARLGKSVCSQADSPYQSNGFLS